QHSAVDWCKQASTRPRIEGKCRRSITGRAPQGTDKGIPLRLEGTSALRLQAEEGTLRGGRRRDLLHEVRAGMDAEVPAEGAQALPGPAHAVVGRRSLRHRLPEHLLLHPLDGEAG